MPTQARAKKVKSPFGVAVFVDIETTGLNPSEHWIIQFSCESFRFNRETGEILEIIDFYTGFQEPLSGSIPRAASRVNKITWEDVENQQLDYARIDKIIEPVEFIVAHNASFDRSFCIYAFPWANEKPWKCSMRHVKWSEKGQNSRKLQDLLKAHGIRVDRAHRADADVKYALELLNYDVGDSTRYFLEIVKHRVMSKVSPEKLEFNLPTRRAPAAALEIEAESQARKAEPVLATESKLLRSENKDTSPKKRGLVSSVLRAIFGK